MKCKIYNPNNLQVDDLPVIYGFNNGGEDNCFSGILISEHGDILGRHISSNEAFMLIDLGILEGTREDRDVEFKAYYPYGFKMEFVSFNDVLSHIKLLKACEWWRAKNGS